MFRKAVSQEKDALDSALAGGCISGDLALVKSLLEKGADPDAEYPACDVGGVGEGRETALGLALRSEHFDIARLLIKYGANVCGNTDQRSFDPLHYAAASLDERSVGIAGLLLDCGADPNGMALCKTPLYCVQLAAMAEMLISRGADVNVINDVWAEGSPLHIAAQSGNTDVARVLLLHGADVNARDCDGHTPLYWARDYGCTETFALLEEHGGKIM